MPSSAPTNRGKAVLAAVCLTGLLFCPTVAADEKLDLDAWRRMPVFVRGRLQPLDSYARDTVERICGRTDPKLLLSDGTSRAFSAAELLLDWLVEPDAWRDVAFLKAEHEQLRADILELPVFDAKGERLKYASLPQLEEAKKFSARQDELMKLDREARDDDDTFQPAGMDHKLFELIEAHSAYRQVIFRPSGAVDGDGLTFQSIAGALTSWSKVANDLRTLLSLNTLRAAAPTAEKINEAIGQLVELVRKDQLTVANADPLLDTLRQASRQLAGQFDDLLEKLYRDPASVLPSAKELTPEQMRKLRSRLKIVAVRIDRTSRLAKKAQLALYDNGGSVFVTPALEAAAIKAERLDNDVQPWLSLQVVLYGSDSLLAGYPRVEIKAVRDAWKATAAAYLDRKNPDRPALFRAAMERFVVAMRTLSEAIEPLREKLPIADSDRDLLAATRYPPPAATRAELHYNVFNPFLWACVVNIAATCCLTLAFGPIRKWGFWIGMGVLVAGQFITGYGFGLRTYITGWAPVTGMFEMVMFTGFVTAVLAVWFVLLPLVWPGMSVAWRMSAFRIPRMGLGGTAGLSSSVSAMARLALMALIVYLLAWLPYGSAGQRAILSLTPRIDVGASVPGAMELVTWLVGVCVLILTAWYIPRVTVAAFWSFVSVPVQWSKQGMARALEQTLARHWIALMGAVMAALIASIAYWSPLWDQGIDTLRPVLRDRFWLYLHVLTITASYGAGALALGLANVAMFVYLFGQYWAPSMSLESLAAMGHRPAGPAPVAAHLRRAPEVCDTLAGYIYKILQVAVVLLAIGTILGALWADVAWGRFWGWDPKEVWALISLLIYLVILHGRYAGWAGHFGLVAGSVFGAVGIVVASWGVNYYWAGAGLHSYASGEGGNLYVLLFLIFEILFLAAAAVRYWLAMLDRAA